MCGIAGQIGRDPRVIQGQYAAYCAMQQTLSRRGPDQRGMFISGRAALIHARLAVVDIENGLQPMQLDWQGESYTLVYNGELYNTPELRTALQNKGHSFTGHSDTEVLLHAFAQWGAGCLERCNGIFAFAVWAQRAGTLFLARDRCGVKPLFYVQTGDSLLFGSEIKSFLAHPGFKKELNEEQLPLYLSYQYSPGEDTFFKGVKKLMPAHWLEWKAGQLTVQRYWQPKFDPDDSRTLEEWEDEISAAMKESVQAHKIADVEVGSFLSSGVDSSYMAALAHVDKTFTVGFANKQYDETDYAQEFSKHIGVKNYAYRITPEEYWANLGKIQYHMDEPLADAASVALYFVNREASKQVKVCLSGEGADEFFGGYNIYKEPFTVTWYDKIPLPIRRAIGAVADLLPPVHGINFLVRRGKPLAERYIGNTNLMDEHRKKKLLKNYHPGKLPTDLSRPYFELSKGQDAVTQMETCDLNLWMVGDILLKADKMSMANSLELRVPFLDRNMLDVALSIPQKYRSGKESTKIALRGAAMKQLPESVAHRKKLGFPVPLNDWLREDKYYNMVKEKFTGPVAEKFFNVDEIMRLLDDHKAGKAKNMTKIWSFYSFILWYELYFVNTQAPAGIY